NCPVTEITTSEHSVTVAYTKHGAPQTITADFCICTMPISILATTKNNFSPETKQAFTAMPMLALYKIGWQSPRFWEKENNIYGGWAKIPYSLGCFANNFLPSSQPAYVQLEKPQGQTYFAGDYLSHLVGWQEGAVLSAHHAVERIAKRLHT